MVDFTVGEARLNLALELSTPVHHTQRDRFLADMAKLLRERRTISMGSVIEAAKALQRKYLGAPPSAAQTIGPMRNRTGDMSDDPAVRARILRARARRQRAKKRNSEAEGT
jgi:hypothetical protein